MRTLVGSGKEIRRVRLQDVAAHAGVSIVTVSRAMNAPETVSPKTRARIDAAMLAIGYVPDLAARGMATRRSGIVATLVPNLLDPIFISMMRGLESVFAKYGIHLLIGDTGYSLEREEAFVVAALGRRPDGLILTGATHTERLRRLVASSGVRVVETWNAVGTPIDRMIGYDHRAAGLVLTRHLVARGYTRIGYVGRPTRDNDRALAKRDGYADALREAGRTVVPELLFECETSMGAGRAAITRLVDGAQADAIVFSGDSIASGAFLACLERGLNVPGDVALCGFGDHEIGHLLPGGLTTISTDAIRIGELSARAIIEGAKPDGSVERSFDVGFELVVRGST